MNKYKFFLSIFVVVIFIFTAHSQTNMIHEEGSFDADVTIHYDDAVYTPSKKEPFHVEKQQADITVKLSCQVMTFRLKQLVKFPAERTKNCSPSTHCPILTGNSKFNECNDKGEQKSEVTLPLNVSVNHTVMDEKSDKLITTYSYAASGLNDMDNVHLEIKPYDAPSGQVQPLTPTYVIWLTGGLGFDFKNPQRKPMGEGNGKRWDEEKQKMVPVQGPFTIIIPSSFNEPDHEIEQSEVYDQLLITNYKELDTYLLNPTGDFMIKASGKRYRNDEGSSESEGSVNVEIKLTPRIILNKLKVPAKSNS